jgi:hypothetical protein
MIYLSRHRKMFHETYIITCQWFEDIKMKEVRQMSSDFRYAFQDLNRMIHRKSQAFLSGTVYNVATKSSVDSGASEFIALFDQFQGANVRSRGGCLCRKIIRQGKVLSLIAASAG